MGQLTEFQQRAAGAALEKLLTGDYFDITGLRKVAALTGAELRGKPPRKKKTSNAQR